jgi:hypothetical protein
MSKKKGKKHASGGADLEAEVKRLRKENHELRKRLKKIAALADDGDLDVVEDNDDIAQAEEAAPVPSPS